MHAQAGTVKVDLKRHLYSTAALDTLWTFQITDLNCSYMGAKLEFWNQKGGYLPPMPLSYVDPALAGWLEHKNNTHLLFETGQRGKLASCMLPQQANLSPFSNEVFAESAKWWCGTFDLYHMQHYCLFIWNILTLWQNPTCSQDGYLHILPLYSLTIQQGYPLLPDSLSSLATHYPVAVFVSLTIHSDSCVTTV